MEVESCFVLSQVVQDALHAAEEHGIVFIDEIDKIVSASGSRLGGMLYFSKLHTTVWSSMRGSSSEKLSYSVLRKQLFPQYLTSLAAVAGPDASAEGVQRDLLPIIEGSIVNTNYGNINTDHILFICSGAFHSCQPKDMLAELQGRLPVRVELKGLT